jgi:hypothetical protein
LPKTENHNEFFEEKHYVSNRLEQESKENEIIILKYKTIILKHTSQLEELSQEIFLKAEESALKKFPREGDQRDYSQK